jgi:hypothetical protein
MSRSSRSSKSVPNEILDMSTGTWGPVGSPGQVTADREGQLPRRWGQDGGEVGTDGWPGDLLWGS